MDRCVCFFFGLAAEVDELHFAEFTIRTLKIHSNASQLTYHFYSTGFTRAGLHVGGINAFGTRI